MTSEIIFKTQNRIRTQTDENRGILVHFWTVLQHVIGWEPHTCAVLWCLESGVAMPVHLAAGNHNLNSESVHALNNALQQREINQFNTTSKPVIQTL